MSSRRRSVTEARMPDARMQEFNAYHEWLGLPPDATSPTYYQILGLGEFEADAAKITQAGDRVITRVPQLPTRIARKGVVAAARRNQLGQKLPARWRGQAGI